MKAHIFFSIMTLGMCVHAFSTEDSPANLATKLTQKTHKDFGNNKITPAQIVAYLKMKAAAKSLDNKTSEEKKDAEKLIIPYSESAPPYRYNPQDGLVGALVAKKFEKKEKDLE